MTKAEAVSRLRAHEPAIRALGIDHLSIFGSTARNQARDDSDVDLAARLSPATRVGAFQFIRMEGQIAALLGHAVDLITEPGEEAPRIQAEIDRDRVRVF